MAENKKNKVLLVDDEDEIRDFLKEELEYNGFETLEAQNGKQAFALLKENKVDLIISDLRMPGGDGRQLIADVDKHICPRPYIFLITGFTDLPSHEAQSLGADELIFKPFSLTDLLNLIRRYI